jgi:hypothetical protein
MKRSRDDEGDEVGMMAKETADAASATMGSAAPVADQPLDGVKVGALADAVERAIDVLTDGQVPVEVEDVGEDVQQLPPKLFAALMALAALAGQFGMEQYAFDPTALGADDQGVAQMLSIVGGMASDPKVAQAARQKGPGKKPPEPRPSKEPAPEPEAERDIDRFV